MFIKKLLVIQMVGILIITICITNSHIFSRNVKKRSRLITFKSHQTNNEQSIQNKIDGLIKLLQSNKQDLNEIYIIFEILRIINRLKDEASQSYPVYWYSRQG